MSLNEEKLDECVYLVALPADRVVYSTRLEMSIQ